MCGWYASPLCTQEVTGWNPVGSTSRRPCKYGFLSAASRLAVRPSGKQVLSNSGTRPCAAPAVDPSHLSPPQPIGQALELSPRLPGDGALEHGRGRKAIGGGSREVTDARTAYTVDATARRQAFPLMKPMQSPADGGHSATAAARYHPNGMTRAHARGHMLATARSEQV